MEKSVPKIMLEKYHKQVVHGLLTINTGHLAPLATRCIVLPTTLR